MNALNPNSDLKHKAAKSFFGYYPKREMFSKDLNSHRDMTSESGRQEERYILTAIDKLAFLVERSPGDLEGQYYVVQLKGPGPAETDLLHCYEEAIKRYPHP